MFRDTVRTLEEEKKGTQRKVCKDDEDRLAELYRKLMAAYSVFVKGGDWRSAI